MRAEERVESKEEVSESRIPRPVPGGTGYIQSLGRWIDNLMRDADDRRKTAEEIEPMLLGEDEMPPDPEPTEPPPPVPDGSGTSSRGTRPAPTHR
jgi:hypothetical protein